ncbi:MAG: hypothetical protein KAU50_11505 [Candidatus Marinimicrobia bacterium]|nr:hypothetical protein [Candidatus Neomarinimicrobiota bacterium]
MSYSLNKQCGACNKGEGCTDSNTIQEAINTIHTSGGAGHLGSGVIDLMCDNFEQEASEEKIKEGAPEAGEQQASKEQSEDQNPAT